MMATLDLLHRAARAGRNMIITHEPTFYNHEDSTQSLSADRVLASKLDFVAKNDMVVWRFHDHWHARRPDGITLGMAKALGWEHYRSAEADGIFVIILGHVMSEEAGMWECAEWLKTFVTVVPVEFIAAEEPYWMPGGRK